MLERIGFFCEDIPAPFGTHHFWQSGEVPLHLRRKREEQGRQIGKPSQAKVKVDAVKLVGGQDLPTKGSLADRGSAKEHSEALIQYQHLFIGEDECRLTGTAPRARSSALISFGRGKNPGRGENVCDTGTARGFISVA